MEAVPALPAISPVRTAPWAQKKEESKKSLSLKEIQDLEAKRAAEVAKRAAAEKALVQQQAAQQAQQGTVVAAQAGLPVNSTWGGKSWGAKVAVVSPGKKSMAQIQKEEEEERAKVASKGREGVTGTPVRGYAGAAATSSTPKVQPPLPAFVFCCLGGTDGWSLRCRRRRRGRWLGRVVVHNQVDRSIAVELIPISHLSRRPRDPPRHANRRWSQRVNHLPRSNLPAQSRISRNGVAHNSNPSPALTVPPHNPLLRLSSGIGIGVLTGRRRILSNDHLTPPQRTRVTTNHRRRNLQPLLNPQRPTLCRRIPQEAQNARVGRRRDDTGDKSRFHGRGVERGVEEGEDGQGSEWGVE
jgi:hypothetical protein